MKNKEIVKQLIELQKESFDKCFLATATIQDEAEKLLISFVRDMPGMNNGGGEVVDKWTDVFKKNRDNIKKAIDDGYNKLDTFFNDIVLLNQNYWMLHDVKKTSEELAAIYKKNCDKFKKQFDENIRFMESIFPVADKSKTSTNQRT